jgi:phage-related minor tail protein
MAQIHPVSVAIRAIDQFTAPFRNMNAAIKSMSAPLQQLQGKYNAVSRSMAAMQKRTAEFGNKARAMGGAMTAGITAPIGVGAALIMRSFDEVDNAMDALAIKTGASGQELKGLEDSFRSLSKTAPNSLQEIGDTIAGVHTRLGLTGAPLEEFAGKILKVARMTGQDAATALETMTKAVNDAGAKGPEAAKMLDIMFLTSQKTGVGIENLGEMMYKFGSPLRALGIDAQESAALLGSFEKAGVNTELVMGSLRVALGKMGKAGVKDLAGGLNKAIASIKQAKTTGEATAIAFQVFGAKAGSDMAMAIREGRFEVEALMKDLKNSEGAIDNTAGATDGFAENLNILLNSIKLVGAKFGEILAPALLKVAEAVASLVGWFGRLSPSIQTFILIAAGIAAAVGPLILVFGLIAGAVANIMAIWPALVVAWTFLSSTLIPSLIAGLSSLSVALFTTPIGWIILGIGALIAAGVLLYKNWGAISAFFAKIWAQMRISFGKFFGVFSQNIEAFKILPDAIMSAWSVLTGFFADLWESIKAPVTAVLNAMGIGGEVNAGGAAAGIPAANANSMQTPAQINKARQQATNVNTSNTEKASVTIDFKNMPRGTNLGQTNTGLNLNINQGFSMLGGT